MNTRLCTCVAVLFAVPVIVPNPARAQPDAPLPGADAQSLRIPSAPRDRAEGLIHLDVVVTDAAGKPVAGLDRDEFSLLESGKQQKILSFDSFDGRGAGTEPPVKIILLIDTIELPVDLAHDERTAVIAYLRREGGRLAHPVSVFLLTDSGLWTVPASSDGNTLVHEIEHNDIKLVRPNVGWKRGSVPEAGDLKETPSGSALPALAQIATDERRQPGRKLLLWMGPGWGIGSGTYADEKRGSPAHFGADTKQRTPALFGTVCWFSALLREAHLALYSFTVGENTRTETNPHTEYYKDYLDGVRVPRKASFMNVYRKVLAVQSGGRVMDDQLDLVKEIEECVQDAGPFYRISFDPSAADHADEYHDLKVVVNRPGIQGRTNTGYYDEPYYAVDPLPAPRRVSVGQLEQLLASNRGESDADLAKKFTEIALTERLSEPRLARLDLAVPGKRTGRELRVLADASAFLDPPPDEVPAQAAPDAAAQQHLLTLASAYLNGTIHKLPDFFARRTTVRYQETPMYFEGGTSVSYRPLHVTDSSTTTVRYRNGYEIAETKPPKIKVGDPQLITYGVFGPVLNLVMDAMERNNGLTWNRWEQAGSGPMAVFRYEIPPEKSLYQVWFCCLPDGDGKRAFERYAGYHVDIGIDPESGAILRLAFQADLKSTTPLARDAIMIEYGPIDIGGKTYVCPVRSVSIIRGRSVRVVSEWDVAFMAYGPYATMLNDITFDRYHLFRSESRILPDSSDSEK
jgi:VWFA-related protein